MAFFSSDREKRLWLWVLVVVVGIYSTLRLTLALAGALRENGLLEASFVLGLLLIGVSIAMVGLKMRVGGAEIGVAVGVAAAYLLVFTRMALPEERTHLIEYGVVAVLVYEALSERRRNGRQVPTPAVLAWIVTTLLGWLDEGIQAFLPGRYYDILDVGFNAFAALLALAAALLLGRARRWRKSHTN